MVAESASASARASDPAELPGQLHKAIVLRRGRLVVAERTAQPKAVMERSASREK